MSVVWLNGALVDERDARISPFDRGLLLGDAVFEALRVYRGRPHALPQHLARLRASCAETRLPFPEGLERAVAQVVAANALPESSLRITVTRGAGGRGTSPEGAGPSTVLVHVAPILHRPEIYARGLRVVSAKRRRIPPSSLPSTIKSTNYLVHVLARIEAEEAGADDALFVDDERQVVEATQANVFALLGEELVTPPLASGCLPGQTRAEVLALAPALGLKPIERALPLSTLRDAREVMLTASVLEVAPVVSLDGAPVGGGAPGPVARRLHELYRKHALSESP